MDAEKVTELLKSKGFDSLESVLDALEKTKADLGKHKTRASDLEQMQNRLQELEAEKKKREDAEKTESERLSARIAELETAAGNAKAEAAAAQRAALLERGLSQHISGVHEKLRTLASEHLRVVLPQKDWKTEADLNHTIEESLKGFTDLVPDELKAIPDGNPAKRSGDTPNPNHPQSRTGFDFNKMLRGE